MRDIEAVPVGAHQQAMPQDSDGSVMHDLLIEDLRQRFYLVAYPREVEADVRDRLEFGLAKYGRPLRAHNGRNPWLDAYQEGLDQLVYLIQAMVELKVESPEDARRLTQLTEMYDSALEIVVGLRRELTRQGIG